MKRGLRKLCDVSDLDQAIAIEGLLLLAGVRHERHRFIGAGRRRGLQRKEAEEFIRFFVHENDLARARNALPLTLRGFKPVGKAVGA